MEHDPLYEGPHTEGFFTKCWYLFLLVAYGIGFFIFSIGEGLWKWARDILKYSK